MCLFITQTKADNHEHLQIVTESWPPHIYLDQSGEVTGQMTQRVKAIMAQAGYQYSLSLYPWPRTYKIALTEKNVLVYPLFKNPQRLERFHFICPFTAKVDLFLFKLRTRHDIRINDIQDAKAYSIGLVRNDHDHIIFKHRGFEDGKHLDPNANDSSSLKKLLKGRIDLMVQSKKSMERLLKQFHLNPEVIDVAFQLPDELTGESCIALSLGTSVHMVEKVRNALELVNQNSALLIIE